MTSSAELTSNTLLKPVRAKYSGGTKYPMHFMDELVSSYRSIPLTIEESQSQENHPSLPVLKELPPSEQGPRPLFFQLIGEWAGLSGSPVDRAHTARQVLVADSENCIVTLATGKASDRTIHYLSKFATKEPLTWNGISTEATLLKCRLLPERIAPTLLGVFKERGRISLAMAPPHHSFWMHANPDMPGCLKELCIYAVQQLHARGILHGDLRPCNVLIGGDAKVTIINYQRSRLVEWHDLIESSPCTPQDLAWEMRAFKWMLDYRGARDLEARSMEDVEAALIVNPGDPGLNNQLQFHRHLIKWVFHPFPPRRFVVPGQSPEDLATEVNLFIDRIEAMKSRVRQHIGTPNPLLLPRTTGLPAATSELEILAGSSSDLSTRSPSRSDQLGSLSASQRTSDFKPSGGSRYNLRSRNIDAFPAGHCSTSRKRNLSSASVRRPINKKFRFDLPDDSENVDESLPLVPPDLTSSLPVREDTVYSETEQKAKEENTMKLIIEANIRRCHDLGLPHPAAFDQDPAHPYWQDPDVQDYMHRLNRKILTKAAAKEKFSENDHKIVRPTRALGNLLREMRAATQLRRMHSIPSPITNAFEEAGGHATKRKRAVEDDGETFQQPDTSGERNASGRKVFEGQCSASSVSSATKRRKHIPPQSILKVKASPVMTSTYTRNTGASIPWRFNTRKLRAFPQQAASFPQQSLEPPSKRRPQTCTELAINWLGGISKFFR